MNNYFNPTKMRYVGITPVNFTVTHDGAGWVDTDCSSLGIHPERLWEIHARTGSSQEAGARAHGSTSASTSQRDSVTVFAHSDNTGHIDLYRGAADMLYTFVGYFE